MYSKVAKLLITLLCFGLLTYGQEFRATVSGHVLDASGAAVPQATVQVTSLTTKEVLTGTTDSTGTYTIPFVRPGEYKITATAKGFKQTVHENVRVEVGQILGIEFKLEVGAVTESIEVTAEAALLDTQTASGGGVVNTQQVAELPLNSRNPFMLGATMAGVNFRGASIWQRPFDNGAIAQWNINGGWQSNNEFLLDGAPNNAQMGGNNIAYVPIVDAVQEFSVQQNTYDAQYGHTSGGVMNTVLKTGGVEFHGSAWEFLRRTPLDANTFQNNSTGAAKTEHYLDQYGFQVTGPVYVPKLLKKNSAVKLFYLGSFENYREGTPDPLSFSYPEKEMRTGDFSKLKDANGNPIKIYDPLTAVYDAAGNVITQRSPFPGNAIPENRINPVAAAVTKYMPSANRATPGGNRYSTNNVYFPDYFAKDRFYNLILKFDWNFGDKNRAFFRHASNDRTEDRNDNGIFNGPGQGGQQPFHRINDAYVADWVTTIAPTLIANVRLSYNRFIETGYGAGNTGFDLTSLGLPKSLVSVLPQPAYFGNWNFDNYTYMGRYEGTNITNNYALQASLTKVAGKHSIHAGADIRRIHYEPRDQGNILHFRTDGSWTQNAYTNPDGVSGDSYADFLLGTQRNGDTYSNYPLLGFFRNWYIAPYVQDDWKVTKRLTLNLGLRWDINMPPDEKWNRINSAFDPTAAAPYLNQIDPKYLDMYPQLRNLKGGMTFAGVNGRPTKVSNINWALFQPRGGFAYQLKEKLVLRGGFGMYYLNPSNDYLQTRGFSTSTQMVTTPDGGRTPFVNLLSNPFPSGINTPDGAAPGLNTAVGDGFNWFDPTFKNPRSHQFSFGFQYQVSKSSTLEVSYVGNRMYNLQSNAGYDEPNLQQRQSCNVLEGGNPNWCHQQVPNPFKGIAAFKGTGMYTNDTVERWQMMRPFPQFTWLTQQGRNDGHMWYNSVQINYRYNMRNGLSMLLNYTMSKQLERWGFNDLQKQTYQQGLYYADRPQYFKATLVYQLPFGSNQRFGANTHGILNRLISGWEANTFFTDSSGEPADLPERVRQLKDPNVDPNWQSYQVRGWSPCVLKMDNSGVVTPMQYSLDNGCGTNYSNYAWMVLPDYAPRETSYRAPNTRMHQTFTMDASLNKMTKVTERLSFQFRAEAFNVMNHYWMGMERFNNNPWDANFGTLKPGSIWTGNTVYPRQIQLGFKAVW